MFPQKSPRKRCDPSNPRQGLSAAKRSLKKQVLLLFVFVLFLTIGSPAIAHKVKTEGNVGATLHVEPNDNPRAGEPAKTWFALTRKGGKVIPLAECNCQLAVYAEPHSPSEPPLIEPSLQAVSVERFQGIPGTEITFPRAGAYQLQLSGKPKDGKSFQPFELKFPVTVAVGSATNNNVQESQTVQNVNQSVTEERTQGVPFWAIALSLLLAVGVFFGVLRMVKKREG
ncbi:hypothetical protein [Brasilonema sennae]|uniref:hypothetical protein n=1 Tax=Brasilonema sennae TaxID=1397703 RepID=UPI001FED1273|nr:hypothetical protein [Brasilonema sennae]